MSTIGTSTRRAPYMYPEERPQARVVAARASRNTCNTRMMEDGERNTPHPSHRSTEYLGQSSPSLFSPSLSPSRRTVPHSCERISSSSFRPQRRSHQMHPLFYIGATTMMGIALWMLTTTGAAWWATHITDPSTYGPA